MTKLEVILIIWQAALVAAIAWQNSRMEVWISGRTRVFRIALAYIASGKSYPAQEQFALAMLNGNHVALARSFPGYAEFYAREIERMEEDDAD